MDIDNLTPEEKMAIMKMREARGKAFNFRQALEELPEDIKNQISEARTCWTIKDSGKSKLIDVCISQLLSIGR